MPIDPRIAAGVQPIDYSNTLAQIGALRQRDQALAQQNQEFGLEQQVRNSLMERQKQADLNAEESDAEWDSAYAAKDWGTMARIDPEATRIIFAQDQASKPPPPINLQQFGGYQLLEQGGRPIPGSVQAPQRAPLRSPGASIQVTTGEPPPVPGEDPRITLAREKARATATGRVEGQNQAQASSDLSRVEMNANNMRGTLKQLKESKGLRYLFGGYSLSPIVPGTPQADASAIWEQVQGKAFLEAFGTLKGGGQITEKEGEKATAAITRLSNRRQSLASALSAIKDLEDVVASAEDNARKKAMGAPQQSGANPVSGKTVIRNPQTGERRVWIETEKGGVWQEIK
jgi:hypothetical protein